MPHHRGLVVGLEKAFLGLSGTLITQVNFALFSGADDVAGYVLFQAVLAGAVGMVVLLIACILCCKGGGGDDYTELPRH
eukprot:gene14870-21968_t